jgi:ABC-type transport system substrate-binding protein
MTRRSLGIVAGIALAVILLGLGTAASLAQTGKPAAKKTAEPATRVPAPTPMPPGKPGGTLNVMLREDLSQGFAIHESATISVVFPSSPCFNNLVMFDPANPVESPDSVVPELAERWSWQDNYRNLVMFLRRNVKWHDGPPSPPRTSSSRST